MRHQEREMRNADGTPREREEDGSPSGETESQRGMQAYPASLDLGASALRLARGVAESAYGMLTLNLPLNRVPCGKSARSLVVLVGSLLILTQLAQSHDAAASGIALLLMWSALGPRLDEIAYDFFSSKKLAEMRTSGRVVLAAIYLILLLSVVENLTQIVVGIFSDDYASQLSTIFDIWGILIMCATFPKVARHIRSTKAKLLV